MSHTIVEFYISITGEKRDSNPGKSVVDLRPSAVAIGSSAAIIIFAMIGTIVLLDLTSFYREIRRRIIFNLHNARYTPVRKTARRYWFPCCVVTEEEMLLFGMSSDQRAAFKIPSQVAEKLSPLHLPRSIRKLSQLQFINDSTASLRSTTRCKLEHIDETQTSFDSAHRQSESSSADYDYYNKEKTTILRLPESAPQIRRARTMSTCNIHGLIEDLSPQSRARVYTAPSLPHSSKGKGNLRNMASKLKEMTAKVSPTEEPETDGMDDASIQNKNCEEIDQHIDKCCEVAKTLDPKNSLLANMKVDLDVKIKAIQAGLYDT